MGLMKAFAGQKGSTPRHEGRKERERKKGREGEVGGEGGQINGHCCVPDWKVQGDTRGHCCPGHPLPYSLTPGCCSRRQLKVPL